ncbi:acyl-CoA dehydrogenase C-terminal domain-containing protein [Sedimenticola thiotaurini]|uniref:3-methylmercaptopropionyl-CoA dehydrogenase n=1 Tax=Sedimenticola thiotaurini TaxID=1543721 RepID=A0A0F7JX31_9GAMM|nr:acyl-CoA dehydrogenase C-terminal domain-containing protein [Sedimenticola thiotaurini]AKH19335.1 acyl-CoA dehydrogenase [Sedimenticola thiotaurini]
MASYKTPLRDMRFVYNELFDPKAIQALPGCEEVTPDLVDAILEEAGKFCEERLFPLNRSGDEEGCHFENGKVTTPAGLKEAYRDFYEMGWGALAADPEYGGQGLPESLSMMVEEIMCSTNFAFSLYPGLTHGAYNALVARASEELKQAYLPNMVAGKWSGSMCLTEPQCGTDLGLIRTKAEPQDDGSYRVTGTKMFITAGEHDLTENIIHLVLARTPDAPKGIKGISLFLVPKIQVNGDGELGQPNGVSCGSIEHKMGINASATCVMNFDDAQGFLVGKLNKGMEAMFIMMNTERLAVGIQGLAIGEAAYQGAVAYARERLQGRALKGPKSPDKPADSLLVHPDVRRMLLIQRAYTEGNRALAGWVATEMDHAHRNPDPRRRQEAEDFVALMTPVVKAFMTDTGSEMANLGVQVFGGHGYIREHGMEQYIRDARIAQIYEGTNGIQAMDLVGRKMPAHMGRYLRRFFHPVRDYLEAKEHDFTMHAFLLPLAKAFGRLQKATAFLAQRGMANPEEAGAAAAEYLRLFGLVALGYLWMRMAEIGLQKRDEDPLFYQAKVDTARFYFERILPQSSALFASIMAGSKCMMKFNDDAF